MDSTVQAVLNSLAQCDQALAATSNNDPTLRALLHELLHQEQAQAFVRQELATLQQEIVQLGLRLEQEQATSGECSGHVPLHAV